MLRRLVRPKDETAAAWMLGNLTHWVVVDDVYSLAFFVKDLFNVVP